MEEGERKQGESGGRIQRRLHSRSARAELRTTLVRGVGLRPGAAAVTFLRARNGGGEAAERVERDAEVEAAPAHDRERE